MSQHDKLEGRAAIALRLRIDVMTGEPIPASERKDGSLPNGESFLQTVIQPTPALAEKGFERTRASYTITELKFAGTSSRDMTSDARVSWERVRDRDPVAMDLLQKTFDAGVRVISIPVSDEDDSRYDLVFSCAIGDTIHILDERIVPADEQDPESGPSAPGTGAARWMVRLLGGVSLWRMVLFLAATVVATLVTDPIVALLGLPVTVPLFVPVGLALAVAALLLLIVGIKIAAWVDSEPRHPLVLLLWPSGRSQQREQDDDRHRHTRAD